MEVESFQTTFINTKMTMNHFLASLFFFIHRSESLLRNIKESIGILMES